MSTKDIFKSEEGRDYIQGYYDEMLMRFPLTMVVRHI